MNKAVNQTLAPAKNAVRRIVAGNEPVILVASMGRTGSTVIYDAVWEGYARRRFGSSAGPAGAFVRSRAWYLDRDPLIGGVVHKTHDFPASLDVPPRPVKAVFCFGSASSAAASVLSCPDRYGRDWTVRHLEHLRAAGSFDEIADRDVLRFGEQVDAWMAESRFPVLRLRYETLWNHPEALSEFFGFPIELPTRKARTSSLETSPYREALQSTYAALDARIADLPDVSDNFALMKAHRQ